MNAHRDAYLQLTALNGSSKKGLRKAALQRAHEIRMFEVEHFWHRANYFWLLQAAVFTAVGLSLFSDKAAKIAILPVALAALGAVTGSAGWFASQGSKFWLSNWERHIDMLEDEFEGGLYKSVFVGEKGTRWSVSRLNDGLGVTFFIFWIIILIFASIQANPIWPFLPTSTLSGICWNQLLTIICWSGMIGGVWFLSTQQSAVTGSFHDIGGKIADAYSAADPVVKGKTGLAIREPKI